MARLEALAPPAVVPLAGDPEAVPVPEESMQEWPALVPEQPASHVVDVAPMPAALMVAPPVGEPIHECFRH